MKNKEITGKESKKELEAMGFVRVSSEFELDNEVCSSFYDNRGYIDYIVKQRMIIEK